MKKRYWLPLVCLGLVWAWNSSLLASAPDNPSIKLLSHRGVHQTYTHDGLTNQTCTATRIYPPEHAFIENTVASSKAAFADGADVVEIDIHPTTDGHFVVFHDWTLDCRTEGKGVTREHDLAYLQSLDIGYGYTADDGATFPLRNQNNEPMPELAAFLSAFPDEKFLINFKSNTDDEGGKFVEFNEEHPQFADNVFGVYGGEKPTNAVLATMKEWRGYTKPQTKSCLIEYISYGWTGIVPNACKNTFVSVPMNYAWLMWGWPNRFQQRLKAVGSDIILLGPMEPSDPGTAGVDRIDQMDRLPKSFDGYVWTNRIELIGPHTKE
jgi:glycerophosphoryl diester phosphodiesterase